MWIPHVNTMFIRIHARTFLHELQSQLTRVQLLDEVMDSGYPFTTEPGLLRTLVRASNTRIRTILGNYNIFEQVHNPSVVQKALTATGIRSSSSSSSSSSSICSLFVFLFPFTHVFSPLTFNPFQCHCHCSRHVARLLPQVTSPPQSLRKHRPRCFLLRLQLQHLLHTITPFISYFRSNLPWRPEDARHSNNRSHIFKSAPIYQLHPCVILTPVPSIPPHLRNSSIYVDIIDFIDCVIDTNGLLASCSVHGDILCNSKLSGRAPEVLLSFSNISIIDDMSLHPCVKYNR
jgi:hypothetical protein